MKNLSKSCNLLEHYNHQLIIDANCQNKTSNFSKSFLKNSSQNCLDLFDEGNYQLRDELHHDSPDQNHMPTVADLNLSNSSTCSGVVTLVRRDLFEILQNIKSKLTSNIIKKL